ncbi:Wiskott-Aldrich syndrome homolog (human) (predicted), isoform CRA_b, partial [Rattus norvegicus]
MSCRRGVKSSTPQMKGRIRPVRMKRMMNGTTELIFLPAGQFLSLHTHSAIEIPLHCQLPNSSVVNSFNLIPTLNSTPRQPLLLPTQGLNRM